MNNFEQYIIKKYNYEGQKWLHNLPNVISQMADKYHLSNLKPVSNLSINYVMTGQQKDLLVIVKLNLDHKDLKQEAMALRNLPKPSVPKIIAEEDGMLLMERIIPGMNLKEYMNIQTEEIKNSNKRIEICCRLMEQIHKNHIESNDCNFPRVEDQFAALDREWTDLPALYLDSARKLKNKLLKSLQEKQIPLVLLHGDLHYENILLAESANNQVWLAIDPKGVIGYPINEVWASIMDIEKDSIHIAEYFGFDLWEVRKWYFVHLMLASCWSIEDKSNPERFLNLAAVAFDFIQ